MARLIALTQGRFAIVDDKDYEELSKYRWRARRDKNMWYAERNTYPDISNTPVFMHRQIMLPKENQAVIHKNGIGLDNRRENLAVISLSTKIQRRPVAEDVTSKYKGVSWYKRDSKWVAAIRIDNKTKFLGYYLIEEEAAEAYDEAAYEKHGESADLNFPHKKFIKDAKLEENLTIEWLLENFESDKIDAKIARGATRNSELIASFAKFCKENPELRFWQALAIWSGHSFILTAENYTSQDRDSVPWDIETIMDTYSWEGRDKSNL